MAEEINLVFRDFNTPGDPGSGEYEPEKPRIRRLLKDMVGSIEGAAAGLVQDKYRYNQGTEVGQDKKIVFSTPIRLLDTNEADGLNALLPSFCQAVKDVVEKYSIPVFDEYNLSGLTPELFRTLQGTEPGYTDMYNPYVTDGTHPTQEGQEILAQAFAGFARGLF